MLAPITNQQPFQAFPISMFDLSPDASLLALPPITMQEVAEKADGKEELIANHLRLVRVLARQIHARLPRHVDLEELVAAGTVGLVDAAARFDGTKSVQFKTYASFRVRGAILDLLRATDWSPRVLRRQGRAIEHAVLALQARGIVAPSETEIAGELDLPLAELQTLRRQIEGLTVASLHAERKDESGTEELEHIPGPDEADPLFRCLEGERRQLLVEAIEVLPDRERLVLNLYYHEELTMREVAEVMGVVESRVSQLHASAVLRLRRALGGKNRPGRTKTGPARGTRAVVRKNGK